MATHPEISTRVRGKTIRLAWTEGPTKGTTQEHIFHKDGTVEWHAVDDVKKEKTPPPAAKKAEAEKPPYIALPLADDVCLVSYLSKSGYTLSVALRFEDGSTLGVASNDKTWFPVRGTFEVMP